MDADNKMSHVCRTCLEQINDINYMKLNDDANKIKDQLLQCVPELDLNLIPNAYLCMFCAHALQDAFDFKQKCLQTEKIIRSHMEENLTPDLEVIKQEFRPQQAIYDAAQTDLGMEIIYIRDEDLPKGDSIATDQDVHSFLEDKDKEPTECKTLNSSRAAAEELRLQTQVMYGTKKDVETAFCCSQCNFKTSRSFLLKQHKVTHKVGTKTVLLKPKIKHKHNGLKKQYKCFMCAFKTSKKLILKNHQRNHKEYACNVCDFKTHSACGFSSHLKRHGIKRGNDFKLDIKVLKKQNSEAVIPENEFKCTKCDYKTSKSKSFQKHLSTHVPNGFNCQHCSFVCANEKKLFKHVAKHRRGLTLGLNHETDVKCPECPYKVKRVFQLKYHMTLHSGDRQFKCKLCTFNATRNYFLQRHMTVHRDDY